MASDGFYLKFMVFAMKAKISVCRLDKQDICESDGNAALAYLPELSVKDRWSRLREFSEQAMVIMKVHKPSCPSVLLDQRYHTCLCVHHV